MRSDVPIPLGDVAMFLIGLPIAVVIGVLMSTLASHPKGEHPIPVKAYDRFARCFESVVPRRQFVCPDGTIWTRTVNGWSVDRPLKRSGVPQG